MKIALGSQSQVKQDAVNNAIKAFGLSVELVAVKASSGIAEQPFDEETILGAENRANDAAQMVADADLTIAIESGIFTRRGCWYRQRYLDIAFVVARLKTGEFVFAESDPVEFPKNAVKETIRRGVRDWTCGKVMQEWGLVDKHDDPHRSLVGKSRAVFINDAVLRLFQELREQGVV